MRPQKDISAFRRRLVDAQMKLAAMVVEDEAFLPIYRKIEDELALLDKDQDALSRARTLAAHAGCHKAMR